MELSPFVDNLREQLAMAAAAGTEEARELAERLTAPLAAATRSGPPRRPLYCRRRNDQGIGPWHRRATTARR